MTERMYHEGIDKALDYLQCATEDQLYEQLDALYGRDRLPDCPSIDTLRQEAYRQTRIDFLNTRHENYRTMKSVLEA